MDNKTMILNGCNFVGEKVEVNVNEIENKIDTEYLIIKNVDITKEIIEKIRKSTNLKKIWIVNCNIIDKLETGNIKILTVERCKNIENIIYEKNLEKLSIIDCQKIDINNIKDLDLKILYLEYLKIDNFNTIENMKKLEELGLLEIDLENETLDKLTNIKKIVLNGSKVKDQKEVVKFFKDRGIEIEFYEKNLPIG